MTSKVSLLPIYRRIFLSHFASCAVDTIYQQTDRFFYFSFVINIGGQHINKIWAWLCQPKIVVDFFVYLLSQDLKREIHKIGMWYSSIGRMKQEFLISFRAVESASRELAELGAVKCL